MRIVSVRQDFTPALDDLAPRRRSSTDCGSKTCQLVTMTLPCAQPFHQMPAAPDRACGRGSLRPAPGRVRGSGRGWSRWADHQHHIGKARVAAVITLFRMLQAASMPMTVVLPEPVAILQA